MARSDCCNDIRSDGTRGKADFVTLIKQARLKYTWPGLHLREQVARFENQQASAGGIGLFNGTLRDSC